MQNFGKELKKTNYFADDLQNLLQNKNNQTDKINAIFNFVKNKVKWNNYYDYFTHEGVKTAYKNGNGNVAEINLILVSMLREAGINANPVLVSTRSHGIPIFPTIEGFNYVIAGIELPNKTILLDATEKYSSVNNLPKRVLNWQGRIVRKNGTSDFIDLFPTVYSLDKKRIGITMEPNGTIKGNARFSYKNLNGILFRNRFDKLVNSELIKALENDYSPIEISKANLFNSDKLDKPLLISMKFTAENQTEIINNKIYFSPLFFLEEKENIFKSDERKLPIDFASPWMDNYSIQITIPDGYKVETLPKNEIIETENNIADFKYTITTKENKIILNVITRVSFPIIPANLYKAFKDIYSKRVKKMKEKVVLIKE